jgi:molybdopterin molybdotransferase
MTPGQNIRYAGEDIAANDILLSAGDVLTSERIMALIACGLTRVAVRKGPSVLILSTGDELVEPGTLLADGQIINSSKYFLATALDDLGLKQVRKMHLADDLSEAQSQLNAILNADAKPDAASKPGFIISTGAVSAGQKDFVPDLLNSLGFEVLFHKVAIRPGKPVLVAAHPVSGVVWLGLPGNPISTAATWLYFARPLLNALGAYPAPKSFWAKLAHATRKPQGLRAFFRGHLNADGSINVPGSQGSAHFRSTLTGNCWVELSEDTAEVAKDTLVRVTLS